MSFLLKIVQGPNAGAEIALVEGVNLSFGRADDCDIILSDSSVADKAFELEVSTERVTAIMPGGKAVKLEPYHVVTIGTSAVVVGPQEGSWKPLVWPRPEKDKDDSPAGQEAEAEAEVAPPPPAKRRSCGCLASVILLLALAGALVYGYRKYPEKGKEYAGKTRECAFKAWALAKEKVESLKKPKVAVEPKESLDAVATDCGFAVSCTDGKTLAKGDFKTRVSRLEATARVYAAKPGAVVDFTDAESLSRAVNEFLALVTEGRLKLERLEGRKVFLSGYANSIGELECVLRALGEDVPKVSGADCSLVNVAALAAAHDGEESRNAVSVAAKYDVPKLKKKGRCEASNSSAKNAEMPVAGILTVPYPCLVLSDGTRAMEGARFGEYVIEKIEADRVRVRQPGGTFEWRP